MSNNAAMNQAILAGADRGKHVGALARLAGAPVLEEGPQERMNTALADREQAMQGGDETALAVAEGQIDELIENARNPPRDPQAGFDGGVRGPRSRPMPGGGRMPTSTELLGEALSARRAERADQEAGGHGRHTRYRPPEDFT